MSAQANRNRTNLPSPLSTFIGREGEIQELKQLLSTHRLVTLTGPGGCGKTRLAIKLSNDLISEFEGAVWFTEFAALTDASLLPQAVASTVGVHEARGDVLIDVLRAYP